MARASKARGRRRADAPASPLRARPTRCARGAPARRRCEGSSAASKRPDGARPCGRTRPRNAPPVPRRGAPGGLGSPAKFWTPCAFGIAWRAASLAVKADGSPGAPRRRRLARARRRGDSATRAAPSKFGPIPCTGTLGAARRRFCTLLSRAGTIAARRRSDDFGAARLRSGRRRRAVEARTEFPAGAPRSAAPRLRGSPDA